MLTYLLIFGGGVFLGLYIGNLKLRTKINDSLTKIINKNKDKENTKKGKGKKS